MTLGDWFHLAFTDKKKMKRKIYYLRAKLRNKKGK